MTQFHILTTLLNYLQLILLFLIIGIFYHTHADDERYHRTSDGSWKVVPDPNKIKNLKKPKKPGQKQYPRIRDGQIWPKRARKTHTVEGLLAAQEARRKDSPWLQKSKKSSLPKKKKTIVHDTNVYLS